MANRLLLSLNHRLFTSNIFEMKRTRREFLSESGKMLAGAGMISAIPALSGSIGKKIAANDKVFVGLIGCNGMGFEDLKSFLRVPGVECAALCDVDQNVLDRRNSDLEKLTGKKAELYSDFRKLIDRKDIDVVIIGTPDHWHCLPLVYACAAGKDIYCEKPLSNSIQDRCQVRSSQLSGISLTESARIRAQRAIFPDSSAI